MTRWVGKKRCVGGQWLSGLQEYIMVAFRGATHNDGFTNEHDINLLCYTR